MAFYTRCANCGKRVEAWDKDLSHPHYCFNCNDDSEDELDDDELDEWFEGILNALTPEERHGLFFGILNKPDEE